MAEEYSDSEVLEICGYNPDVMTKEELATAIVKEIRDVWMVSNHCSHIYTWATNNQISKSTTAPETVIAIAEDIQMAEIEKAATEEVLARLKGDSLTTVQNFVIKKVLHERLRQDRKFGEFPRNLKPTAWLTILVEEVGEVARATIEGQSQDYAKELVEVAAVAIAALEDYYGGQPDLQLEDVCPPIQYHQPIKEV